MFLFPSIRVVLYVSGWFWLLLLNIGCFLSALRTFRLQNARQERVGPYVMRFGNAPLTARQEILGAYTGTSELKTVVLETKNRVVLPRVFLMRRRLQVFWPPNKTQCLIAGHCDVPSGGSKQMLSGFLSVRAFRLLERRS